LKFCISNLAILDKFYCGKSVFFSIYIYFFFFFAYLIAQILVIKFLRKNTWFVAHLRHTWFISGKLYIARFFLRNHYNILFGIWFFFLIFYQNFSHPQNQSHNDGCMMFHTIGDNPSHVGNMLLEYYVDKTIERNLKLKCIT